MKSVDIFNYKNHTNKILIKFIFNKIENIRLDHN